MIAKELLKKLKSLGIKNGDIIYVASDVSVFGVPQELKKEALTKGAKSILSSYIETFVKAVGKKGVVLMPTFTYSACENKIFDVKNTPSTVGALTEHFRKTPRVIRSTHPIFSFCALGQNASKTLLFDSYSCFGKGSFFEKLDKENITCILFGVKMNQGATFVTYAEEKYKVPYRYIKDFNATIKLATGKKIKVKVPYFVRDYSISYQDNWENLETQAIKKGLVRVTKYSGAKIMRMKTKAVVEFIGEQLRKNPDYLIDRE